MKYIQVTGICDAIYLYLIRGSFLYVDFMERQKFVPKNEHILSVVNSDYRSINRGENISLQLS